MEIRDMEELHEASDYITEHAYNNIKDLAAFQRWYLKKKEVKECSE